MRISRLFFAAFAVFLLAGCASGQPRLVAETARFDFGDVVNGQVVARDLEVRNEGDAPLLVAAVSTSCGCTTATLDPMTIAPGSTAILTVVFDSGAHGPGLAGPITRQIFIRSNDPGKAELVIEFDSNILPPEG